jgi:hypothetical protein
MQWRTRSHQYFEAQRPRGAEERGGENTGVSGFRARTDGHRSRKQAGNGHWSRTQSKWSVSMIASDCHAQMLVARKVWFAVSVFALSILCLNVSRTADAQSEFGMKKFGASEMVAGRRMKPQRHGLRESHPRRRCRFTANSTLIRTTPLAKTMTASLR